MKFEFDPVKSAANGVKHGINFHQAEELWSDLDALEIPARSEIEKRRMLIARLGGKLWAAIYMERGDGIRIISVRRARKNEETIYDQTHEDNREKS